MKNAILGFLVLIVILGVVYAYSYYNDSEQSESVKIQSTSEEITNESLEVDKASPKQDTQDWKTYNYKNMTLQYPNDWSVVFNGEVANQPNGFDISVIKRGEESSIQPNNAFGLSTYDSRSQTSSLYVLSEGRTFKAGQDGDSYIAFTVNGVKFYASCAFYSQDPQTLTICNRIASTVSVK